MDYKMKMFYRRCELLDMAPAQRSKECNHLVFEAVNESSVSKLRFVRHNFLDAEILASLAKCNDKGENPLVVAIKGKNFALVYELVNFLQNWLINDWRHQITWKAFDQLYHKIPIMELLEHLILNAFRDNSWLGLHAQVFIKSTKFTRQDKIIALELIGALLLMDSVVHSTEYSCALQCWREAMVLRYSPDGEPLPKIPDVYVPSVAYSVVFESAVEFISMEELNQLLEQIDHDFYLNDSFPLIPGVRPTCKLLQRQALLVIRRVTSQLNNGLPHITYLNNLLKFGKHFENETNPGNSALVINTYLLILEQMTGCDPKMLSRKLFQIFVNTLRNISKYFIRMLQEPADSPGRQELSYANLLPPTKFFGTIAMFLPYPAMMSSPIFNLVFVLESISPQMSSQEKQQLEEYFSNYIRNLFTDRTTTLLHLAVRNIEVVNPATIKLILKLGVDPNAVDKNGKTPLHILAGIETLIWRRDLDRNISLFQALVNGGTRLDLAADNGDTVLSVLQKNLERYKNGEINIPHPYFESLIYDVFPLSCQCARVIRRHRIPFDGNRLPPRLQEFVSS